MTTTSIGMTIFLEYSPLRISFASSIKLFSTKESPILCPMADKKVFNIPPPNIIWSDFNISFFINVSLVDILAPDIIVVSGLV